MASEEKLQIRKAIKKRKPTYLKRQANQFPKLKKVGAWRRPKGMGNKSRRNKRGHIGMLQIGYGSPKEVKGTNRNGYYEVVISNVKELESLDKQTQVGVLSKTLGQKKRLEVLKIAQKNNITITNVVDINSYIKSVEESMKEKKDSKAKTKNTNKQNKKESNNKQSTNSEEKDTSDDKESENTQNKANTNTATTKQSQSDSKSSSTVEDSSEKKTSEVNNK